MKHIIIGDIHGRDDWQQINIRNYDKIVFIGDYVDSHENPISPYSKTSKRSSA